MRVGYVDECIFHAQCLFRLRSQTFGANDQIRASDGDAVDLLVNRHFLPLNWHPPFIPHAPGAEGLELLQRGVRLGKTGRQQDLSSQDRRRLSQTVPISLHSTLPIDARDVEGVPFTLAIFLNQKQVKEAGTA